jgi:hypothetical protein
MIKSDCNIIHEYTNNVVTIVNEGFSNENKMVSSKKAAISFYSDEFVEQNIIRRMKNDVTIN